MAYIAALEVQGFGAWRLCVRHLLPNISGLIVAQGTILFGFAMVDLAAISFLGLGSPVAAGGLGGDGLRGQDRSAAGLPDRVAVRGRVHRRSSSSAVSFLGERLGRGSSEDAPMSALLEVRDLTVALQMDAGPPRGDHRHVAWRSVPARRWGWSASPARASR